jgi:hypothetical protein
MRRSMSMSTADDAALRDLGFEQGPRSPLFNAEDAIAVRQADALRSWDDPFWRNAEEYRDELGVKPPWAEQDAAVLPVRQA